MKVVSKLRELDIILTHTCQDSMNVVRILPTQDDATLVSYNNNYAVNLCVFFCFVVTNLVGGLVNGFCQDS